MNQVQKVFWLLIVIFGIGIWPVIAEEDPIRSSSSDLDIVILLDVSNSLNNNDRDDLRHQVARFTVEYLQTVFREYTNSRLAIIPFAGMADRGVSFEDLSQIKTDMLFELDQSQTEMQVGTNFKNALDAATEFLDVESKNHLGRRHVVLLITDGQPDYFANDVERRNHLNQAVASELTRFLKNYELFFIDVGANRFQDFWSSFTDSGYTYTSVKDSAGLVHVYDVLAPLTGLPSANRHTLFGSPFSLPLLKDGQFLIIFPDGLSRNISGVFTLSNRDNGAQEAITLGGERNLLYLIRPLKGNWDIDFIGQGSVIYGLCLLPTLTPSPRPTEIPTITTPTSNPTATSSPTSKPTATFTPTSIPTVTFTPSRSQTAISRHTITPTTVPITAHKPIIAKLTAPPFFWSYMFSLLCLVLLMILLVLFLNKQITKMHFRPWVPDFRTILEQARQALLQGNYKRAGNLYHEAYSTLLNWIGSLSRNIGKDVKDMTEGLQIMQLLVHFEAVITALEETSIDEPVWSHLESMIVETFSRARDDWKTRLQLLHFLLSRITDNNKVITLLQKLISNEKSEQGMESKIIAIYEGFSQLFSGDICETNIQEYLKKVLCALHTFLAGDEEDEYAKEWLSLYETLSNYAKINSYDEIDTRAENESHFLVFPPTAFIVYMQIPRVVETNAGSETRNELRERVKNNVINLYGPNKRVLEIIVDKWKE